MMALHEAEYLLPSVDSLDGPLDLSCGIIAPREDSEEEDEALGMPTLLQPPPSPSSVVQEDLGLQSCLPAVNKASSVTWVHFGRLAANPEQTEEEPEVKEEDGVEKEGEEEAMKAILEEEEAAEEGRQPEAASAGHLKGPEAKKAASCRLQAREETPVDPLRCEHCSFRARNRHCLNNHHRQRHRDERFRHMRQCQACPVAGCPVTKFHSSRMVQHLNAEHGAKIQKVELFFNSPEEFLRWKAAEERKVGVSFTKRTGDRHGPHMRATNYTCSRFGTQMYRYAGSSRSLRLGSGQTDDYCPSRMNVVFYDNRLMVVYFRKHSHDVAAGPDYWVDLKNLPLSINSLGAGEKVLTTVSPSAGDVGVTAKPAVCPKTPTGGGPVLPMATGPLPAKRQRTENSLQFSSTSAKAVSQATRPNPSPALPPPAPPARVYSSLCDSLRSQMVALGEALRAGIPEGVLDSVVELHGAQNRLLTELAARRREKHVFPLVLRQARPS